MIYLDSNILIYAFSKNVDTQEQQTKSIKIFEKLISKNKLCISDIALYEFAFVSQKIKEQSGNIKNNLDFLKRYSLPTNQIIRNRAINIMNELNLYKNSFDCFHLAHAENYCEKIYTFDLGFKKLSQIATIEIEILKC